MSELDRLFEAAIPLVLGVGLIAHGYVAGVHLRSIQVRNRRYLGDEALHFGILQMIVGAIAVSFGAFMLHVFFT